MRNDTAKWIGKNKNAALLLVNLLVGGYQNTNFVSLCALEAEAPSTGWPTHFSIIYLFIFALIDIPRMSCIDFWVSFFQKMYKTKSIFVSSFYFENFCESTQYQYGSLEALFFFFFFFFIYFLKEACWLVLWLKIRRWITLIIIIVWKSLKGYTQKKNKNSSAHVRLLNFVAP